MIADEGQYFNFSISTCSSRDDFNAGLRCIFIYREREQDGGEGEWTNFRKGLRRSRGDTSFGNGSIFVSSLPILMEGSGGCGTPFSPFLCIMWPHVKKPYWPPRSHEEYLHFISPPAFLHVRSLSPLRALLSPSSSVAGESSFEMAPKWHLLHLVANSTTVQLQ